MSYICFCNKGLLDFLCLCGAFLATEARNSQNAIDWAKATWRYYSSLSDSGFGGDLSTRQKK